MDRLEVGILLGLVIYSIWSEITKGQGGSETTKGQTGSSPDAADVPDLESIDEFLKESVDEFFKKKSGTPDPGSASVPETGMTSTDYQSPSLYPEPVQSSFIADTTKQQAAKARKSRKKSKSAQQNNQADGIDPTHGALLMILLNQSTVRRP